MAAPAFTTTRLQQLWAGLEAARADVLAAVDAVPEALRETAPGPGRWSAAQVLEHLAKVEHGLGRIIESKVGAARAAGLGAETATEIASIEAVLARFPVGDRRRHVEAPPVVQPEGALRAADGLTAIAASRARLAEVLAAVDGLALGEVVHPHPFAGPLSIYEWLVFSRAHEQRHAQQIAECAGVREGAGA